MKIAVFSDVQGNIAALEVVVDHIERWEPDFVVMNGDLINRGPKSLECLQLFNEKVERAGWLPIKGNHEEYVLHCVDSVPETPQEADLRRFTDWTAQKLGDTANTMRNWPDHLTLGDHSQNSWVHFTHGTLAGNRDGISPTVPDENLVGKLPEDIDLFVTAHTHKVHERQFNGHHILNVGSVGSPFDGDVRASYAQLTFEDDQWNSEVIRLDYDRERMARDFVDSGFMEEGGPLTKVVYLEWEKAELIIATWNRAYRQAVLEGKISIEKAVEEFMQKH